VGDAIVFWIMAPLSVISAAAMVLSRKPVHSALWLVSTSSRSPCSS